MKIFIVGDGETGMHFAKMLSSENQDITLLGFNREKLSELDASQNVLTIMGNHLSFKDLKEAGAGGSDLFVAVTPSETENMIVCQMAKELGARQTVARIDNYEFMSERNAEFFRRKGIDRLVYPEFLAALEIRHSLDKNWTRNWYELHNGELIVAVVKIRSGAFPAGKQLRNLMEYHSRFHVSAIRRGREFIIPRGDDYLLENDILYFTVLPGHVDDLISFCGKRKERIRRLLILGASRTALRLVKLLEGSDFRVTIIDSSRDRCREVAAKCDATIVNADARDLRLLQEEGIREADAFVALTGSSETNIVSCMIAREFGVKKTIAEIEDIEYMAEAERLNIDTIVNKKLASSSAVVQMILDSDLSSPRCLVLPDAEVAEIVARPNSRITSEKVRNLKLSKEMTIAGLTRNDVGMLVDGETRICDGDHVVVFCKQGALRKVERLFN